MFGKVSIIAISLLVIFLSSNDTFQSGMAFYNSRADDHVGYNAKPEIIDQALQNFIESYNENPTAKKAEYVLRSYYFKGNFATKDEGEQEKVYEDGKNFGLKAIEKFPNSAEVLYYHAITYGKWGEYVGLWIGLKEDAADNLKEYFEKVIELDPKVIDAGGHRILGLIHYKIPYVPFLVPWPSIEEAENNLKKALEYFPENPTNIYLYAEFLEDVGRDEESTLYIKKVLNMAPRHSYIVEDTWAKIKAKELLSEIND
jgi:tetratricopeptide (TPR) repeat protein